MTRWHAACLALALALGACQSDPVKPGTEPPSKGFPTTPEVRESVYLPVDRTSPPPAGYGMYTVLLTRTVNRSTLRLLSDLFVTTDAAGEAAMARENLNLIMIPVKARAEAARALAPARNQAEATANALMQRFYDFGQAARLMDSVCRPERGEAVMKVCGSAASEGPLLVTTRLPLDAAVGQPILVVNLSNTPPDAMREVLAAYRREIRSKEFPTGGEVNTMRLRVLNRLLDAAQMLPWISKAYASGTGK